MRIVLTDNCTTDGVIDMAAGWCNAADQTDDQPLAATRAHMAMQDAQVLGCSTFEAFRGYCPTRPPTPPGSPTT